MGELDHFVLTRFSAVLAPGRGPMAEDLLRYRMAFFREATVASLAGQTERRFRWLVFVDDRCPDSFRAEMEDLAEHGGFEPVWTHRPFWDGVPAEAVAERSDAPHLLTTRLDSDDALAREFVASAQAVAAGHEGLFVNFTRGLQVDRTGAVFRYDHRSNPFVSYVERRTTGTAPATVYGPRGHSSVRDHGPLLEVKAPPMWMQVVHGGNLANDIRGSRVAPGVVRERFAIDLPYDEVTGRFRLAAEWAVGQARVWRLRAARPELAREWVDTRLLRWGGTRLRPARDAAQAARSAERRRLVQRRR